MKGDAAVPSLRPNAFRECVLEKKQASFGAIDGAIRGYRLADEARHVSDGDAVGVSRHAASASLHGGDALGRDRDFHGLGVPDEAQGGEVLRRPKIAFGGFELQSDLPLGKVHRHDYRSG